MNITKALDVRKAMVVAAAVLAVALGTMSIAWACSPQPRASVAGGTSSGRPGAKITITGQDFGPGPVQVRWNSRTGQVLGESQGPNFSVGVTIPEAAPGVHYIVAMQTLGTETASLAFEVTAPSAAAAPDEGAEPSVVTSTSASGTDEESHAKRATGDSTAGAAQSQSTTATSVQTTQSGGGDHVSGTASTQATQVATSEATPAHAGLAQAGTGSAPSPASTGSTGVQGRPASANAAAVSTPAGQLVFGGSAPAAANVSAGTVSGDTWSGFAVATKPSLLFGGVTPPASRTSSGSGLAVGVGLLVGGVVALAAGFSAAEAARKRSLAGGAAR